MTKKTGLKFLMLGLPLVALAAVVLVLTLGNGGNSKTAEAAGTNYAGHFAVGACTTKCNIALSGVYTVDIYMDKITAPYDGISLDLTGSTGPCKNANDNMGGDWAHELTFSGCLGGNQGEVGASKGAAGTVVDPSATRLGIVGSVSFNCDASGTVSLDATSFVVNATSGGSDPMVIAPLPVNCVAATSTSTATATSTPLPGIQMQKCYNLLTTFGNDCQQSSNLFLTNRNPSQFCNAGQSITLVEGLSNDPPNGTAKGEEGLGAFQFEVRYPKGICLDFVLPGSLAFTAISPTTPVGSVACTAFDQGKGLAKIGCVTLGKTRTLTTLLAGIIVHVDKEAVQAIKPNQDNGSAFQILDQGCQIADLQGHQITLLSCEDAELSVRFLEGDVVPNCAVDVSDTQDIAFRWNAGSGQQLYQTFKDLMPSSPANGDGVIHIDDLQFVFGRFGSTCANPWPAQPPFNDKTD